MKLNDEGIAKGMRWARSKPRSSRPIPTQGQASDRGSSSAPDRFSAGLQPVPQGIPVEFKVRCPACREIVDSFTARLVPESLTKHEVVDCSQVPGWGARCACGLTQIFRRERGRLWRWVRRADAPDESLTGFREVVMYYRPRTGIMSVGQPEG